MTDRNASAIKSLLVTFTHFLPTLHTPILHQVMTVMKQLGDDVAHGLDTLCTLDLQSTAVLTTGVAALGRRMTRCATLCAEFVSALEWTPEIAWAPGVKRDQFKVLAHALDALGAELEPTWKRFSVAADLVEQALRASQGAETSRVLPTGVAQLQPLTECYFVLADAVRAVHAPPDEEYITNTKPQDRIPWLEGGSQGQLDPAFSQQLPPSQTPGPSQSLSQHHYMSPQGSLDAPMSPTKRAMSDVHTVQFLKFAERHRRLVNLLVHHSPGALKGSLALLLRAPRLLDFDNKRAYFRSKIKEKDSRAQYGTLRLSVRRDHVFEDSFYQLRVRSPEEMRSKLSVTFAGEEGVDAGGLTREWYQVISREMFNPQFSLFQAVPEGAVTFQPNPNSVVQSDPARGTDHLDFFKFVGRVVGKALHDGQHIDAHFTRSFYK